jgi:hypothetical protein
MGAAATSPRRGATNAALSCGKQAIAQFSRRAGSGINTVRDRSLLRHIASLAVSLQTMLSLVTLGMLDFTAEGSAELVSTR